MKRTTILLGSLAVMLLMAACSGGGFKKTRSGLLYKVISDGKGKTVQRGQVMKFHVSQRIKSGSKDTLLGETYGKMPQYAPVDSIGPMYHPAEIFPLLRKGDSAVVVMLADTLFKKNPGGLPPYIHKKDKIYITFKILDVFTADSLAQKDQMTEGMKEQTRQQAEQQKLAEEGIKLRPVAIKEIEDYLAKNKISYQKTANGTYVQIKDPGNGVQADSGKKLSVKYVGKLFPTGKEFESNTYDGLVLGTGSVIRGWEEGLAFFKKGGKGTLYIPFFEAYGDRPGPGGKAHASLMFDVEILDVQDAPAAPAAPAAPGPGAPVPNDPHTNH